MNIKLFCAVLTAYLFTVTAQADSGWSIGLGMVTSDIYPNTEPSGIIFPTIEVGTKQAMLIPDVAYHWDQWSVGATGLSWKSKTDSELKSSFTVGFPRSAVRIGGQKGWFRYGVFSNVQLTNGALLSGGFNLGPLGYEQSRGLADRQSERADTVSFGAPVFISKKLSLTVIGKLSYSVSNANYKTHDFKLSSALPTGDYVDISANLFAIKKLGDSIIWINSGTFTFADNQQQALVEGLKPVHFNLFSLIQYSF